MQEAVQEAVQEERRPILLWEQGPRSSERVRKVEEAMVGWVVLCLQEIRKSRLSSHSVLRLSSKHEIPQFLTWVCCHLVPIGLEALEARVLQAKHSIADSKGTARWMRKHYCAPRNKSAWCVCAVKEKVSVRTKAGDAKCQARTERPVWIESIRFSIR